MINFIKELITDFRKVLRDLEADVNKRMKKFHKNAEKILEKKGE